MAKELAAELELVCEGKNDPVPELDRALPNDGKLLNPFTDPFTEDIMLVLPLPVLLLPLKPKLRSEDGAGDLGAKREAFHCEGLVDILLSYRRSRWKKVGVHRE